MLNAIGVKEITIAYALELFSKGATLCVENGRVEAIVFPVQNRK